MPELPEVETFKRFVDCHALGKKIGKVQVLHAKILEGVPTDRFIAAIEGCCLSGTLRRGKHLFVALEPVDARQKGVAKPWLYLHFGMTGYLSYTEQGKTMVNAYGDPNRPDAHVRVRFCFEDDSYLDFHEQRLFGKAGLVDNPQDYLENRHLGPDALMVERQPFIESLQSRKGQIKPVLLNQSMVAGIGNVYADEMLFQCRIHPERRVAELTEADLQCLYAQMVDVLQNTVDVGSDRAQLPPYYLIHVREKKGRCPRDKTLLTVKTIGGRTTYFCPVCQH
jgi:formamidopyrimidine-DNA glycosylase